MRAVPEGVRSPQYHRDHLTAGPSANPCSDIPCRYSYMAKLGKPKGSRNKKTFEKLSRMAAPSPSQMNTPSSTANLSHTSSIAGSVPSLDHISSTPQSGSQFGDGYDFPLPSDLFSSMLGLDLPADIQSWNVSFHLCSKGSRSRGKLKKQKK